MVTQKKIDGKRDMHIHLDKKHDLMLGQIGHKLWEDQKRGGSPTDIEGIRHAISTTHAQMFK